VQQPQPPRSTKASPKCASNARIWGLVTARVTPIRAPVFFSPRASRTDLASGQQMDPRTSREKLVAQRRWNDKYFWQGRSSTPGDG
jgi:hypothetical protein